MDSSSLLKSWGVPPYLFRFAPFDPKDALGRFSVYEADHSRTFSEDKRRATTISLKEQRKTLDDLETDPFSIGSVLCLCSEHNGLDAKLAAMHLLKAIARKHGVVASCLWHVVYGGTKDDKLVDRLRVPSSLTTKPKLVVFSDTTMTSTALKKERLHDLLEANGNAASIVAASGGNPVEFMRSIGRHQTGVAFFPAKKRSTIR